MNPSLHNIVVYYISANLDLDNDHNFKWIINNAMNCQFDQFEAKVNVQSQYSVTLN